MASPEPLPKTHRALVLPSIGQLLAVKTIPTPQPGPGSVVVQILAAPVVPYMREIYDGTRWTTYPTPLVTGTSAVGHVAAVGPDATLLKPGQLVYVDCTIRGRDDPSAAFLHGIHEGFTDGSRKLMHGEWRDSTYATYAKVPLENCFVLDEKRLVGKPEEGGLGYSFGNLAYIVTPLVPYGGLRDIDIKAGETVIVCPATGSFGGAAVSVALAMGARVIAMGRNLDALKELATLSERVEIVQTTGDVEADVKALQKFGAIDACLDISPPAAAKSTHLRSAILSLRPGGRVSLMGGISGDVSLPHDVIMYRSLRLQGKWMYNREDITALIKLIEVGLLNIGESAGVRIVGEFALEDWDGAFTAAAENTGRGKLVLLKP
ncbi:hypothetical protein MMC30_006924 [Trapelia coarctata]|nr:hypothetical protein [Trapelia coarctata]